MDWEKGRLLKEPYIIVLQCSYLGKCFCFLNEAWIAVVIMLFLMMEPPNSGTAGLLRVCFIW